MSEVKSEIPQWFVDALATPTETGTVAVDGTDVAFHSWGPKSDRGIILVHGGGAHSRWWDHVAPLFAPDRRVVALDLSGHGDSGRRDKYTLDLWAQEILAVATAAGITAPPMVIGHSMGGFVTLRAASLFGAQLSGVVAIDSPVRDLTPEEKAAREQHAFGPLRVYPSKQAVLNRFRPIPDQPALAYIAAHVAETSIRHVGGGWQWKFDPRVFGREPFTPALLTRLDCRVALLRAEHGIVTDQMSEIMYDRLGRVAPVIELPAAGHHVMLDQPIALVAAIRTLLSDWDHSEPTAYHH